MKLCTLVVAVTALAFHVTAHSADTGAQVADARTLLGLMKFDAQIEEAWKQCVQTTKTITPESVYQGNPGQFGGITPQSRLWPSVVNAFQTFYNDVCTYIDREAFVASAAQSYSTALTKQELTEAIRFYSSPIGKKLADAQVTAGAAFQKEAAARLAESYKRANEDFARKLTDLVRGSRKPSD